MVLLKKILMERADSRSTTSPIATKPRLITHHRTHGRGVHRFDMDEKYAYISTEMEGYIGNILVIYDLRNPAKPEEVSRWWLPGQHTAGGEKPTWPGRRNRLHHALRFGDELWAGCWHGGVARDRHLRHPQAAHARRLQLPSAVPRALAYLHAACRSRSAAGSIAVAIDEEDHAHSRRRDGAAHAAGRTAACGCSMSPTCEHQAAVDLRGERARLAVEPRHAGALRRAPVPGAHETARSSTAPGSPGGLRIVDVADPSAPQEVGHFIPEPAAGKVAPQSNDVDVDRERPDLPRRPLHRPRHPGIHSALAPESRHDLRSTSGSRARCSRRIRVGVPVATSAPRPASRSRRSFSFSTAFELRLRLQHQRRRRRRRHHARRAR